MSSSFTRVSGVLVALGLFGCGSSVELPPPSDDAGDDAALDGALDSTPDTASDAKDATPDTSAPGPFGSTCAKDADCQSGICLPIGRCSKGCTGAAGCPASSNWQCVTAPGKAPACDCTVLSPTEIGCNGLDDDCNGQIDEGSKTCGTTCVDLKNDANNCGSCGLVCGGGMICKAGVCACPTTKPYVCGAK